MPTTRYPGIADSILEAIGNTPLVRLSKITAGTEANILAKCEHLNPSGSIKDRMALQMVTEAEAAGKIRPGVSTICCASSGNTAQAVSMVAAIRGYSVKIYFPEATGVPEKMRPLTRYGAENEVVSMEDEEANRLARNAGLHGATIEIPARVRALQHEETLPDHYWIRQFSNPGNVAGQSEIARELLAQTNGKIDVFLASIGTGGTFLGVAQVLKRELPNVKCIALQPAGWEGWEDPLSPEKKFVPGISGGILEEIRDSGIADEVLLIGNEEARHMAYRLSCEEGIDCGMSSGANVYAALEEARRSEARGKTIVTVLVDRGDRYLSKEIYTT